MTTKAKTKRQPNPNTEAAVKLWMKRMGVTCLWLWGDGEITGSSVPREAYDFSKLSDLIAVIDLKQYIAKRKSLKGVEARLRKALRPKRKVKK